MQPQLNQVAKEELARHLAQFKTAPFLFIGSGLSIRYMGLENWNGLLKKFSEECEREFGYYSSLANDNLPQAASLLAKDFHSYWWNNPKYADSKAKALSANQVRLIHDPLKIEIADYVKKAEIVNDDEILAEIELFKKIVVDGIITTNYDNFLERVFPEYKVYVGQDSMLFSSQSGIGEIYKIHGSCDDAKSLVLTAEDYADYNRKNSYLAAKLLAFFTEHPIIFLGYSLSDDNIQAIISSIAQCLDADNIDKLGDRLMIISYNSKAEEASISHSIRVFDRDIRVPILSITTNKFGWIYEVIGGIQRQFPAKILRQLKEQVYDLVLGNYDSDNKKKLYVIDIDKADEHNQLEVVFGVGAIQQISNKGYEGMTRMDLLHDLLEERNYNAEAVIHKLLPKLLVSSLYTPVFKYLRKAGYLDNNGELLPDESERLPEIVKKVVSSTRDSFKHSATTYGNKYSSLFHPNLYNKSPSESLAFLSRQRVRDVIYCMPFCPDEILDLSWMYNFLVENKAYMVIENPNDRSAYGKFASLYDFLRYKSLVNIS